MSNNSFTPASVGSGYNLSVLDDNFSDIEDALDDTLSRTSSTDNDMNVDLDMNSNDILNANRIDVTSLYVNGVPVTSSDDAVEDVGTYVTDKQEEITGLVIEPSDGSDLAVGDTVTEDATGLRIDGTLYETVGDIVAGTVTSINDYSVVIDSTTTVDIRAALTGHVVYNVLDYGAVADYVRPSADRRGESGTANTDSTDAFLAAIADAAKTNGVVYIPAAPEGYAYYLTDGIYTLNEDTGWRGVSIIGENRGGAALYFDVSAGTECIACRGSSGKFSNIRIEHLTLRVHNEAQGQGIVINRLDGLGLYDLDISYGFEKGLYYSNGDASGGWTEFCDANKIVLRDNDINIDLQQDGGDVSMRGLKFLNINIVIDTDAGQVGLNIGDGVVAYNVNWQFNMTCGSATTPSSYFIQNAGNVRGVAVMTFESSASSNSESAMIDNTGGWNTTGEWRILGGTDSASYNDTSTSPFISDTYRTPVTPTDSLWDELSNPVIVAQGGTTGRNLHQGRLLGYHADAASIVGSTLITNSDVSDDIQRKQGLLLATTASVSETSEDVVPGMVVSPYGIFGLRQLVFSHYNSSNDQVVINSNGRSTGVCGRYETGTITADDGVTQTITTGLLNVNTGIMSDITISLYTSGTVFRWTASYKGTPSPYGVTKSCVQIAEVSVANDGTGGVTTPTSVYFDTSGYLNFNVITGVDLTYKIEMVGNGQY